MSNELNFYDRQMLQYWLRSKQSLRSISKIMRKDVSVISREIKRNSSGRDRYRADIAQWLCDKRRHKKRKGKLDKYPNLKEYVEEKLLLGWSPEQISGRLKEHPPLELKGLGISHESIYYWIYEKSEKHKELYRCLRAHRPKRKRKGKRKSEKIAIPSRISIHCRPRIVNRRIRVGDWESDTVEFKRRRNNPYLSVQYERKVQLIRMNKMRDKTAKETNNAIIKTIESLPTHMFKTITFDNGKEGSKHIELKEMFDIETYFCDPFSSWQKGGVENANKLIRQYLPKDVNIKEITDDQIYQIQERLNNRPRKGLNYLTPNEIINESVALKP